MEQINQQAPQQVNQPVQTSVENPVPKKTEVKPKKNFSLTIILSFTTIIATLIAAFFYFQNTKLRTELIKKIESIPTPTSIPSPTEIPDETANMFDTNSFLYKNTDLGFSLNIPNDWKDKYQTKTVYFNDSDKISEISFEYLSTDKVNPTYKIFSIGRMTLEDWNKEIKIADMPHITEDAKIISSGNYVFYYTISLDNPYSESSNDKTTYSLLHTSIQDILKTFKLIN